MWVTSSGWIEDVIATPLLKSVDPSLALPGYKRAERPLCLVWRGPG